MKNIIKFLILVAGFIVLVTQASGVEAQGIATTWSQCTDGRAITRCETYNCPQGDTNRDGRCSLSDTNAKLTDARNDSFCANPISGCGQVHYYPSGTSGACLERVEEAGNNCDLYAVANQTFTPNPTASPSVSPTARPTSTPTASASATPASEKGGDKELPKTGPEDYWPVFVVLGLGALGLFLRERHKLA